MTLYRSTRNIAFGERVVPAGILGQWRQCSAKALAVHVARGTLVEVAPPPLAVLPGWSYRGEKLAGLGIVDAEQMLVADVARVAEYMGVSPGLVRRWQADLETWLATPPSRRS